MRKDKTLQIRLTEEDRDILKANAGEETVTDFIVGRCVNLSESSKPLAVKDEEVLRDHPAVKKVVREVIRLCFESKMEDLVEFLKVLSGYAENGSPELVDQIKKKVDEWEGALRQLRWLE